MIITDIEPQKHYPNRVNIFIDDAYSFSMEREDYEALSLKVGKSITEAERQNIEEEAVYGKAKMIALQFISYKLRTSKEVREKLTKLGYDDTVIGKVVDRLLELRYIDDEAYAKQYIEYAMQTKKWGKKRIAQELKLKGISISDFDIEEEKDTEREVLSQLIQKKLSTAGELTPKEKNRIVGYCVRRGYSYEDIFSVLSEVIDGAFDEDYE